MSGYKWHRVVAVASFLSLAACGGTERDCCTTQAGELIDCDANPTASQCCEQTGMCPSTPTCSTFNVKVQNSLSDGVTRSLNVEADVWYDWSAFWYYHTSPDHRYYLMTNTPVYTNGTTTLAGGPAAYSFQNVTCVDPGGVFILHADEVVPLDANGQALRQPLPSYQAQVNTADPSKTYDCLADIGMYSGSPSITVTCTAR